MFALTLAAHLPIWRESAQCAMRNAQLHRRLLVIALAMMLGACAPGASGPASTHAPDPASVAAETLRVSFRVTVTDDAGRRVQVNTPPARIVSAAPSTTEILFALGLGDHVAGVTTFCNYPEEATSKPKIGGLRPSLETIVAQSPDLVLAVRGTPPDTIAALEAQGVPAIILNPPDFAGVLANVRLVGRVTGAVDAAERLTTQMQARWNAIAERAKTASKRPRVFYEVDATDPASVVAAGPGTFIDAMITAGGGENVLAPFAHGQQYPRVSAELILQANPDLIILGNAAYGQSAETVARRPGWNAVNAVRRGAIAGIHNPDVVSRAGPRLVEGFELIAQAIHPDLFGERR